MKAKDHYDKHLGNFYSWLYGNFNDKQKEGETFFRENNVLPFSSKIAFDLGAGHGLQSISLAHLGFFVKAVDFNMQLLLELKNNAVNLGIEIVEGELIDFLKHQKSKADAITCMGDTISHLERIDDVEVLVKECEQHLVEGGKVVFSFRDLTTTLKEEQRFIPMKNDETRVATCFLEYFPDHVMVYDILYEKSDDAWQQKISAYPKLRLNEKIVTDLFERNKIRVIHTETINRMIYIIGQR